jgi:hypothetical protein
VDSTHLSTLLQVVARAFSDLPIFKRSRGEALLHYYVALEAHLPWLTQPEAAHVYGRMAIESSMQAIPAIYRNCTVAPDYVAHFNAGAYRDAVELFEFAVRYEQVMYCVALAKRDQFAVRFDYLSRTVVFSYTSQEESEADTLLRSRERVSHWERGMSSVDRTLIDNAMADARAELYRTIVFAGINEIHYQLTPPLSRTAQQLASSVARAKSADWNLPDPIALGTLTMGDARRFWSAVITICNLHFAAHLLAAGTSPSSLPKGSVVLCKTRAEWTDLISEAAGIAPVATSELLYWFTFDPSVAESTPPMQPFLPITPDLLAISRVLTDTTNHQRTLLKLLNRHPRLRPFYDNVRSAKEGIALGHLAALFLPPRFATKPQVLIAGVTDVDLLVYEPSTGFVLIIQHKWPIEPDTPNESASNDDELRKGASQAIASRDALRGNHHLVRNALGLTPAEPMNTVEAVVIVRGSEASGFLGNLGVPVIMEYAFERLNAQAQSLPQLWALLKERPDHARASRELDDTMGTLVVGGVRFAMPTFGKEIEV